MGWKASMIIIENKGDVKEEEIVKGLGLTDYEFESETSLEYAIYPNDKSINIGYYNGNIIICDDYLLTDGIINDSMDLSTVEENIVKLFPESEVITVACHSVVNYHGYSVLNKGEKVRTKSISADSAKEEYGELLEEETKIYSTAVLQDGEYVWNEDGEEYFEDQYMEDFTFEIAKRRLGVRLDYEDGETLMNDVVFRKYVSSSKGVDLNLNQTKEKESTKKWIGPAVAIGLYIVWKIIKYTLLKE